MKLDNKYIHDQCSLVQEEDLEEAQKIGLDMLSYVKQQKYLSLAANQVGYNKQIVVVIDDDGYDIYYNPEIKPQEVVDGIISVAPEGSEFPAIIPSFPRKKVLCYLYDNIEVDAYSLSNDDRINFKASGDLAKIWQINALILNGIDPESIVPCDFMTIKGKEKKKPNAKCPECGYKNKKCKCEQPELTTVR
jgi:peptide deformylase